MEQGVVVRFPVARDLLIGIERWLENLLQRQFGQSRTGVVAE
jgi:hypothetical protein